MSLATFTNGMYVLFSHQMLELGGLVVMDSPWCCRVPQLLWLMTKYNGTSGHENRAEMTQRSQRTYADNLHAGSFDVDGGIPFVPSCTAVYHLTPGDCSGRSVQTARDPSYDRRQNTGGAESRNDASPS